VLLDYERWAAKQGIKYTVFEGHSIPVSQLEAVAKDQGVEFRQGDILLIRIGWTTTYYGLTREQRDALPHRSPVRHTGIEKSKDTARWLWNTGFAACGSDASGLEKWPVETEGPDVGVDGMHLHEVLLGGWGMPIGKPFHSHASTYAIQND
jgi:kynurenine formamidase